MKEVLVLGGGGFIGRNIVQFLIERGDCNVTAADIREGSNWCHISSNEEYSTRFTSIIDDFTNIDAFNKLEKRFDEIYMLAAVVGVNRTLKKPQDVIKINSKLIINTLDWISQNPTKRLLFSSSSENYAGTSDLFKIKIPTAEDVPLCISDIKHPRWTYAITKIFGESAFIHSARAYNYNYTVIRYQNIIGPEMGFSHAIPHIVERFIVNKESPYQIYGHNQTRSFCYIDDAVRGTVLAMEQKKSEDEIYHIGNNHETSMEELTHYIGNILGYEGGYEKAETYPGSVERRCPDVSRALKDLGYAPKISWKEAVKKTVAWYRQYFESGNYPKKDGFKPPNKVFGNSFK